MKLLAIDTSTELCSAALSIDGAVIERHELAPGAHSRLILPMIESLFAESGLQLRQMDALAFGRGPGSFTGVRIAASVVQGLAFGADIPVVPVSTLAAVAQGAWSLHGWPQILAALDARMGEVYWGSFGIDDKNIMRSQHDEAVAAPGRVALSLPGEWCGAGSGWQSYGDALAAAVGARIVNKDGALLPQAVHMLPLAIADVHAGKAVTAEQAIPVYLRDQVAHVSRQVVPRQ